MNKDVLKLLDPGKVPKKKLSNGLVMPCIGMGTFSSDRFTGDQVAKAVKGAIKVGYRLFDCASVYGNEHLIGKVFHDAIENNIVNRHDLFIMSKLWNDMHGEGDVLISLKKSLKDLCLEYVDAYFVHWPFPNYHAPGCDGDSRNPNSKPFSVDSFMVTWRQMEKLYERGLAKSIGMSSMTIPKLKAVLPLCKVKPHLIEMELHPTFQQNELYDYCKKQGIEIIGFCPIGSPTRPDRDKTENDLVDIKEPVIVEIAKKHNIHPALVCLKWALQKGHIPIPFSIYENEYYSNLMITMSEPLSEDEMNKIKTVDANCRLIKGQVFLWKDANDWHDLWDEDGVITKI